MQRKLCRYNLLEYKISIATVIAIVVDTRFALVVQWMLRILVLSIPCQCNTANWIYTKVEKLIWKPWRHCSKHDIQYSYVWTHSMRSFSFLDRYMFVLCITCHFTVLNVFNSILINKILIICSLLVCHTNTNGFVMLKHCQVGAFIGECLPFQFAPVPMNIKQKCFHLHGNGSHDLPLALSLKNFAVLQWIRKFELRVKLFPFWIALSRFHI